MSNCIKQQSVTIPVWVTVTGRAEAMLQIVDRVESSEATALDRLGHRVVAPTCSTGLYLGHAELRLQEEVEAAVGQQQRVLEDPGEHGRWANGTAELYIEPFVRVKTHDGAVCGK